MPQQVYEMNLVRLVEKFRSEDKCRAYLERLRWPQGVCCPRCQGRTISRIAKRNQFDCDSCRFQFSVTSGTIFHDTKLPLWKWFLAVYMVVESKKGVSANQLKRTLEVSYRTAWYLCHRIRKALEGQDSFLRGVVEIDATYVGGRISGQGRGMKPQNKTLVIGAVERGGRARFKSARLDGNSENQRAVGKFLRANISECATVYTDKSGAFVTETRKRGNKHDSVNHSADEWLRGDVHTNGIEGAWSLFKRSVVGAYHQVSLKHLPAYLDEFEYRFNNRENPYIFRDALAMLVQSGNLEYSTLVSEEANPS